MTTNDKPKTGLDLLREPFAPNQINKLPKPLKSRDDDRGKCEPGSRYSADGNYCGGYHARSIHLDYVGHAALTARLLDADPNWTWEPLAVDEQGLPAFDQSGGLWIRLTICGITRLGYGDAGGKSGGNAIKEAIGDALRNAGMRFGAALDLWHKGDLYEAEENRGAEDRPAAAPARAPRNRSTTTAELPPVADPRVAAVERVLKAAQARNLSNHDMQDEFELWASEDPSANTDTKAASAEQLNKFAAYLEKLAADDAAVDRAREKNTKLQAVTA